MIQYKCSVLRLRYHYEPVRPNAFRKPVPGEVPPSIRRLFSQTLSWLSTHPNLATWEFSPAANEIERHVLAAIASRFGWKLEPNGIAHFTSGGQEANHTAVAVALTSKFPEIERQGLRGLRKTPVFYASEEGHHSFDKVAHSTGLGRDALRFVPAASDLRMDLEALVPLDL